MNLHAIHTLRASDTLDAVELNASATAELRRWGHANVHEMSIFGFQPTRSYDFVFTKAC